jgi:hypothetical protein
MKLTLKTCWTKRRFVSRYWHWVAVVATRGHEDVCVLVADNGRFVDWVGSER